VFLFDHIAGFTLNVRVMSDFRTKDCQPPDSVFEQLMLLVNFGMAGKRNHQITPSQKTI
jgi:hypothetical protein